MRQHIFATSLRAVPLFALGLLSVGCGKDKRADNPLPDWSAGFENPEGSGDGRVVAVPAGAFGLAEATDVTYDTRIRITDTDNPCEVFPDGTTGGYEGIDCTLDIAELDLFGAGLDFDLFVPAGGCQYVVYRHYMYEAWEIGVGPVSVTREIDANGNILSETNSVDGDPTCEFDYSKQHPDAPNCCTGVYTVTVTNTDTSQVTTSETRYWGGNPADCYNGAAYIDPEATFTENGWPTGKIVNTAGDAWNKRFHWDLLADKFFGNVPLANYYDPAEHSGTMPAGLAGIFAVPTYNFYCYDHAEELLAEIRLTVKEWNEEVEFYADGDPDTTGVEALSGTPINDRADWADATPDSVSFIGFAQ